MFVEIVSTLDPVGKKLARLYGAHLACLLVYNTLDRCSMLFLILKEMALWRDNSLLGGLRLGRHGCLAPVRGEELLVIHREVLLLELSCLLRLKI